MSKNEVILTFFGKHVKRLPKSRMNIQYPAGYLARFIADWHKQLTGEVVAIAPDDITATAAALNYRVGPIDRDKCFNLDFPALRDSATLKEIYGGAR